MKRHPDLIPLSQEHHHSLAICVRILRQPEQNHQQELSKHFIELEKHFQCEEHTFAPLWEKLNQPTLHNRFLQEHQQLRDLIHHPQFNQPEWNKQFATLLRNHARFEERELFPAIESLLSESTTTHHVK